NLTRKPKRGRRVWFARSHRDEEGGVEGVCVGRHDWFLKRLWPAAFAQSTRRPQKGRPNTLPVLESPLRPGEERTGPPARGPRIPSPSAGDIPTASLRAGWSPPPSRQRQVP